MSYNLEKVVNPHQPIYTQLNNYYRFCEQVCQMTDSTLKSKTYALNNFVATTHVNDLRKLTNRQVYDWMERQTLRGNSGRSVNNRLAHLKAMLRWQQDMNLVMPKLRIGLITKAIEAPARKVCFSRAEVTAALRYADEETWLLIRLAFDCGLRISELRGIRLRDLHGDQITIIGKGQKKRFAYLCTQVHQRLRAWICTQQIQNYLWPSPLQPDQPLAVCTIRAHMRRAFAQAGLQNFCPHDLRHSYATDLKRLGASTRQIQFGLGHSSEAVTERYLSDLEGFNLRELYQLKYSQPNSQA